jgi:sarcosine oxidase
VIDVAVVGLGAMGSMTLWRLAARGAAAAGFDQFVPPHDRGSSHGESRIIRTAYAEGAFYVPLIREAFALWRELEADSGARLLTMTGALMIGRREGALVSGALASCEAHGLEHQVVDVEHAAVLFPQHVLDAEDVALWEPEAGFLRPEACIAAALARAEMLGAGVNRSTPVVAIEDDADRVVIHLAGGASVEARHGVLAAGSWTGRLVPELNAHLQVERQVLAWFALDDAAPFQPERFPVFVRELPDGRVRYGLPTLDGTSIKLAVHHEGAVADPDRIDREVSAADLAPLQEFVASRLHGVATQAVRAAVCMYTNTPDERFLIGSLPGRPRVTVVGGCSGHSFKFASVMGDIAADLALAGRTERDVSAFALDRAALVSPPR